MKKNEYVFGAAVAVAAISGSGLLESKAHAATIGGFSFETAQNQALFPTYTSPYTGTNTASATVIFTSTSSITSAAVGPILADSGVGSAYGVHTSASTVYSEPAGNGSSRSLSATVWAVGDYYQFGVPTTGYRSLLLTFDQTSSGTGPKTFALTYSVDGTAFSTLTTYSFATVGFSGASTSLTAASKSFDLSSVTALNNDALAVFRLVDADATVTNPGGTDRVDNVVLSGTAIAPEPAALAVLSIAGGALVGRRRKH